MALARKLMGFVGALELTINDLRPHFLYLPLRTNQCLQQFYNADKVLVEDSSVKARRLILCADTHDFENGIGASRHTAVGADVAPPPVS